MIDMILAFVIIGATFAGTGYLALADDIREWKRNRL